MLEKVAEMYGEKKDYLHKMNRDRYISKTVVFHKSYGDLIKEMTDYVDNSESAGKAAKEVAHVFAEEIRKEYCPKGKPKMGAKVDVTMFTIYYVFPALLMTGNPHAREICDAIVAEWPGLFGNEIGYATYEKLRDSFRNTMFGISIPKKK